MPCESCWKTLLGVDLADISDEGGDSRYPRDEDYSFRKSIDGPGLLKHASHSRRVSSEHSPFYIRGRLGSQPPGACLERVARFKENTRRSKRTAYTRIFSGLAMETDTNEGGVSGACNTVANGGCHREQDSKGSQWALSSIPKAASVTTTTTTVLKDYTLLGPRMPYREMHWCSGCFLA